MLCRTEPVRDPGGSLSSQPRLALQIGVIAWVARWQKGQERVEPPGSPGRPGPALTVNVLYCVLMHEPCLRLTN